MYYTTDAIVLKSIPVGEADALVTLYTREFGKIRARAAGIKKEGAKLRGHLESLSRCTVSFVVGKNGERLTYAELTRFWHHLRTEPELLSAAAYIASLIDTHCLMGERDEALWELFSSSFSRLDLEDFSKKTSIEEFIRSFEISFLALLGYAGERDLAILPTNRSLP